MKFLQLCGRRKIAEPRKYCLVRVIVFFLWCVFSLFLLFLTGWDFWFNSLQLLAGAICIEVYAAILLSASNWPWLEYEGLMELLQTKFAPIRKHCAKLITSNQRWSNSTGQLNLLSFALKDKSD